MTSSESNKEKNDKTRNKKKNPVMAAYDEDGVRDAVAKYAARESILSYNTMPYDVRKANFERSKQRTPQFYKGQEFVSRDADEPMVYDLPTRQWNPFMKKIVLSYLRRQDLIEWYCPGIEYDAFDIGDITDKEYHDALKDNTKSWRIAGAGHGMADESWRWEDSLPYYVSEHDIDLPDRFIAYVLNHYIDLLSPAIESQRREAETGEKQEDVNIVVPPVLDSFSMNGFTRNSSGKVSNIFGDDYVEKKKKMHAEKNKELLEFYEEMIERFDELVEMRDALDDTSHDISIS